MKSEKTIAVLGEDARGEISDALEKLGFEVILLPRFERLAEPVSSHADMLILPIENKVFTSKEYFRRAISAFERLSEYGYEVVPCDTTLSAVYPDDVAFDALFLNRHILCHAQKLPREVVQAATEAGFSIIHSRQGYAKCSAVAVCDNAIITADKNIEVCARAAGAQVMTLTASPKHIALCGYDCGFIGGTSGCFGDTVYFSGDISTHPDGEKIKEFCSGLGKRTVSLSSRPLTDIGGIFFFYNLTSK